MGIDTGAHRYVGIDNVCYVGKKETGTLRSVFSCVEPLVIAFSPAGSNSLCLASGDLVSANLQPSHWVQSIDGGDSPPKLGLPEDCVEQPNSSSRSHRRIRHSFDAELWSREASELAPHFDGDWITGRFLQNSYHMSSSRAAGEKTNPVTAS
jgi:hypothetical protein